MGKISPEEKGPMRRDKGICLGDTHARPASPDRIAAARGLILESVTNWHAPQTRRKQRGNL